jgi:hypothetical protein
LTDAPRPLALLFAACTVGASIYGTGFWILRDRGPAIESYRTAAEKVRSGYKPGDLVMLVPFYATRGREWLGDLRPVAPRFPLAEDLRKHRRVWVFGTFGEGERLREELRRAGLELVAPSEPAPGITVDLYDVREPWTIEHDFLQHLRRARVHHEHDGREERCDRWDERNGQGGPYGRWICPHDADWFYVAPEWHRMGDQLRLCFWAHPPSSGRIVIRFPDVPLTGHLFGYAGHTLNGSVYARERIFFDVEVTGLAPQRFDLPLDEKWRPFALATPSTGTGTVTFAVSTPDAGTNHFCFSADMRRAP